MRLTRVHKFEIPFQLDQLKHELKEVSIKVEFCWKASAYYIYLIGGIYSLKSSLYYHRLIPVEMTLMLRWTSSKCYSRIKDILRRYVNGED